MQACPKATGVARIGQHKARYHQQHKNCQHDCAVKAFALDMLDVMGLQLRKRAGVGGGIGHGAFL